MNAHAQDPAKHGTNRNSWEAITRQLAGVEHSRSDRTLSVPESGTVHNHARNIKIISSESSRLAKSIGNI